MLSFQQQTLQPQNTTQNNLQFIYGEVFQMQQINETLKQHQNTTSAELEALKGKLEQNKTHLTQAIFQKTGQDKSKPNQVQNVGEFQGYVVQLEQSMGGQLKQIRDKNQLIIQELIKAHKLLEKYAISKRKLNKNSAKELGLIQDIEELRDRASIVFNRLEEHENKVQFSEEYTDLSKNPRIIDFNEQSIELIKELKKDYIASKITLDKSQHNIKSMLENLNDTNKQTK
ncbi:unnamed protein product (macronuclear) [Paramecium tetraurelia]|uniref:Nucleoporin Nup54 alpha-helical domain-containing protein n=1 Tax=Paramecium tetraurelia TaxID=5888 RepID=A0DT97_PARTE|nr:uncharacterized protein GSPATT00019957001 [Paramecium tetraurelia]CAK86264.1 unnamed protein product [Paramecium tetraurelia]|eukprot:XP_001453661.1 hypothetical protein (macronuclear) [Paramecium tetraurelia strain d4-2]